MNEFYFNRFSEFLAEVKLADVQAVAPSTLSDFQRWIFYQPTQQGTARSIGGQNHIIIAVKNFFTFLAQEGYIAGNPAKGLRLAREPDTLPKNILTPEEFAFQAPEGGYQSPLMIDMSATNENWQGEIRSKYYLQLPDGKYGRIDFYFLPYNGVFTVQSAINPTGSRNLEPPP